MSEENALVLYGEEFKDKETTETGKIAELERQLASNLNITAPESEKQLVKRGKMNLGILNTMDDLSDEALERTDESSKNVYLDMMNKVLETLLQEREKENEELKLTIANFEQRMQSGEAVFAENRTVETVTTVTISKQVDQVANAQVLGYNNLNIEQMLNTIRNQEQSLLQMKKEIEIKTAEYAGLLETVQGANQEKCFLSSNIEGLRQENLELKNNLASSQNEIQNLLKKSQGEEHKMLVAAQTVTALESKCVEFNEEIVKLKVELDNREKFCEEGSKTIFHLQQSNQAVRDEVKVMLHNVKQISAEKVELLNKISNMEASRTETESCLTLLKSELNKSNEAIQGFGQKIQAIKADVTQLHIKCAKDKFIDLENLKPIFGHFEETNVNHMECNNLEMSNENHQRTDASPCLSDTDSVVEIFDSRLPRNSQSPDRFSSCSGQSNCRPRGRSKSRSRRSPSSSCSSTRRSCYMGRSSSTRRSLSRRRSPSSRRSLSRRRSQSSRRSSSPHSNERYVSQMHCSRLGRSDIKVVKYFGKKNKSYTRRGSSRHDSVSSERRYKRNRRSSSPSPRRSRSRVRGRSRSVSRPNSRLNYHNGTDERNQQLYSRRNSGSSSSSHLTSQLRSEQNTAMSSATESNVPLLLPPPVFKFEVPPEFQGSAFDINSTSNRFPVSVFNRQNAEINGTSNLTPLTNLVSSKNGNRISGTINEGGAVPIVLNVGGNGVSNELSPSAFIQKFTVSVQKNVPGYNHGKHPMRELDDHCKHRGWTQPYYQQKRKHGEFFFSVKVNNRWYHHQQGSTSSRDSQMMAAIYCLQELGVPV